MFKYEGACGATSDFSDNTVLRNKSVTHITMEVESQLNGNQHKKQKTTKNGSASNTPSKTKSSEITNSDSLALKIHHCKFFEWMPSMITSISFSSNNKYLAVGYQNGNIELRSEKNNWFAERVIKEISAKNLIEGHP